jgi:Dolichyl-phosphate-mannose-protein mannosyltransferase
MSVEKSWRDENLVGRRRPSWAGFESTQAGSLEILYWLGFYTAAVALSFAISHAVGDLHNDVLEAYAWGKELQFGYHKHPPFWAWAAYLYFSIFPKTAWSGYLLGSINAAIGLGCTWLIARRYLPSTRSTASVLCLMTTTMYQFHALPAELS